MTRALVAWLALLTACTADPGADPPSERPNFLVILADDIGIDLVEAYSRAADPASMPTVASLAREGLLFERAYAAPVCSATRAALLAGRYGRRSGVGGVIGDDDPPFALPLAEVTLAEVLATADAPYASSAIGKWHLANLGADRQLQHAYDQGFEYRAGSNGNINSDDAYVGWSENVGGQLIRQPGYATTVAADDAIFRILTAPEPWFLYLAFNAAHTPLHAPPPALVPSGRTADTYPDAVRAIAEAMDTELGRVLASIPPEVRERTTIVFMADNGTTHEAVLPPFDPEDAKGRPTEGGTHVPLIIAGAGVPAGGQRCPAMVHAVDLLPTLAELAGIDVAALAGEDGEPLALDGHSLVPFLSDPDAPPIRELLYHERFSPNGPPPYTDFDWTSVRDDRYLYAQGNDGDWFALYDVESTWPVPGPDLIADGADDEERAVAEAMRQALEAAKAALPYAHGG